VSLTNDQNQTPHQVAQEKKYLNLVRIFDNNSNSKDNQKSDTKQTANRKLSDEERKKEKRKLRLEEFKKSIVGESL